MIITRLLNNYTLRYGNVAKYALCLNRYTLKYPSYFPAQHPRFLLFTPLFHKYTPATPAYWWNLWKTYISFPNLTWQIHVSYVVTSLFAKHFRFLQHKFPTSFAHTWVISWFLLLYNINASALLRNLQIIYTLVPILQHRRLTRQISRLIRSIVKYFTRSSLVPPTHRINLQIKGKFNVTGNSRTRRARYSFFFPAYSPHIVYRRLHKQALIRTATGALNVKLLYYVNIS